MYCYGFSGLNYDSFRKKSNGSELFLAKVILYLIFFLHMNTLHINKNMIDPHPELVCKDATHIAIAFIQCTLWLVYYCKIQIKLKMKLHNNLQKYTVFCVRIRVIVINC